MTALISQNPKQTEYLLSKLLTLPASSPELERRFERYIQALPHEQNVYLTVTPSSNFETLAKIALVHPNMAIRIKDCSDKQFTTVMEQVTAACPQLRELDLSAYSTIQEGFVHATFPTGLMKLLLRRTRITDAGLKHIAEICPQITYLDLSYCKQLTNKAFIDTTFSPNLERLMIKNSSIDDEGLQKILLSCTDLIELLVDECSNITEKYNHSVLI
jgi:hypothetical protein